jgi:protease-4
MSEMEPVTTPRVEDSGPPLSRPAEGAGPTRKSRVPSFFFGVFSGCLIGIVAFSFIVAMIAAGRTETSSSDFFSTQKVAIVPIEGEIFEARETVDLLHRYADSATVRAMVVRINSPGGAVAPSQEIYEEIRKVRAKSHKPIVASLDSVAASGGFYIASACDQIVSNPGSITGSIGVILQWMEIKDLIAWAKMKPNTITSGTMKDAGSPYSDLTDAERAYLQRITTQLHGQFIRAVAEGRKGKMSLADVERIADGRVFTGEEALSLKLVDRIGNMDDAVMTAARLAGVRGRPGLMYPKRRKQPSLLELLTNTNDSKSVVDRVLSRRGATFLYRW